MKKILLLNTSFKNKGDALMNETIYQRIGSENVWAIPANLAFVSRKEAKGFKVCMYSDLPGATKKQIIFNLIVATAGKLLSMAPTQLRERTGLLTLKDINLAIDVSGYCYGDHWGEKRVIAGTEVYKKLSNLGAKVILMPKTWGPFSTIPSQKINEIFNYVNLAFARDAKSKKTLDGIVSRKNTRKIFFAPDYTHGASTADTPPLPSYSISETDQKLKIAYIVPSSRVIDSKTLTKEMYYELISTARKEFEKHGLKPKLLIHETSNDLRFSKDSAMMGFSESDVIQVDDPLSLKKTIASAQAVLTSRLHGLYNSLNSAVPVAVIAWCFKYEEALDQYNCRNCIVDLSKPIESLKEKIHLITDPEQASNLKERMLQGKLESRDLSEKMWEKIMEIAGEQ